MNRPFYEVMLNMLYDDLLVIKDLNKTITDGRTQTIRRVENGEFQIDISTLKNGDVDDMFIMKIERKGAII